MKHTGRNSLVYFPSFYKVFFICYSAVVGYIRGSWRMQLEVKIRTTAKWLGSLPIRQKMIAKV